MSEEIDPADRSLVQGLFADANQKLKSGLVKDPSGGQDNAGKIRLPEGVPQNMIPQQMPPQQPHTGLEDMQQYMPPQPQYQPPQPQSLPIHSGGQTLFPVDIENTILRKLISIETTLKKLVDIEKDRQKNED